MYISTTGKRLIGVFNERNGEQHTPKSFFDDVYFGLFFQGERYLFNANNSPVDQAYKSKGKKPLTIEVLDEQRRLIHTKINAGQKDASIFVGGASTDLLASTSGLVTDLAKPVLPDDIYASWIGAGLGVTIEGGLTLLIDDEEVLWTLFEGWQNYRNLLDDTLRLKPNQVNTWNGQWLVNRFARGFSEGKSMDPAYDTEGKALTTVSWVKLMFALCWKFRKSPGRTINVYVYSFGQMNRTAGMVRINLPDVRRLYSALFEIPTGHQAASFEDLYETEFSFTRALQFGEIGVRTLQPKDLRGFMDGSKKPLYKPSDTQKIVQFQIQLQWIIAMLNNKQLVDKAEELALLLQQHANQDQRLKNVFYNQVQEVLDSKSRRDFIEHLTEIVKKSNHDPAEILNVLIGEVAVLPMENMSLFTTLLRFKYAYLEAKQRPTPATAQ